MAEGDEGGVDAVLQGRAVANEVEPEACPLALRADRRVGQPDRGHEVAAGELGEDPGVDLSVLAARGARPLTFWASAISTSQPASSSLSWTKRAPFIDSMAALTGWPWRR